MCRYITSIFVLAICCIHLSVDGPEVERRPEDGL